MNINPADVAHQAVLEHTHGARVTPDTIHAGLIANGATPAQAATVTRLAVALIPTVTPASLNAWQAA